jgi:mycothiol maleylpyruvate isomerase-like protein
MDERAALFEAAEAYASLLDDAGVAAKWDTDSALADYTVGMIVSHVTHAVGWLEPLLDTTDPGDRRPIRVGKYYTGMKVDPATPRPPMHDWVRDMSAKSAKHGAEAETAKFRSLVERLRERLATEDLDRVLDMSPAVPATIRMRDFLATRVIELVVHGDDLAASLGLDCPPLAQQAADVAIATLVATARGAHGDVEVIRALSRRERAGPDVFPVF